MKVIINNINIYHIHDNKCIINGNNFKARNGKIDDADFSGFTAHIVVNDNPGHPLIAQLEARILESDQEKRELLEKLNCESK
ncbi:MAG: hypothetical protein ACHQIM_17225 [Sphingobacteriales bacterium]